MNEKAFGRNYEIAKAEADEVDKQIIVTLSGGNSFRVEAGAGSGKTYSLNKTIEWIQSNKWNDYKRKKGVALNQFIQALIDINEVCSYTDSQFVFLDIDTNQPKIVEKVIKQYEIKYKITLSEIKKNKYILKKMISELKENYRINYGVISKIIRNWFSNYYKIKQ